MHEIETGGYAEGQERAGGGRKEDDFLLISRCISGDRQGWEKLVRRFSDHVYKTVQYTFKTKRITYSRPEIEDLHNIVFVSLFENRCRKLRQYEGKNGCSLSSWIRIIAARTVVDHLRKFRTDPLAGPVPLDDVDIKTDEPEQWSRIEKEEQWRLASKGMDSLPQRDRLLLKLHYLEGLSMKEAAEVIQVTEENAHVIKHRALKRLKELVSAPGQRKAQPAE
jgi:RNA polymerase sigma factor (sigma-70 family)